MCVFQKTKEEYERLREEERLKILISLQAMEKNDYCTNGHVLMDRIGIIYSCEIPERGIDSRIITTNINLPMNEEKLKQLVKILKETAGL